MKTAWSVRCSFVALATLMISGVAASAQTLEVVRVEEEWSLEVGEPNLEKNAPQVNMVMSPHGDLEADYVVFELNFRSYPAHHEGGLQVQLHYGDQLVATSDSTVNGPLDSDAETVNWTQVMTVNNGVVTFDVQDGSSNSWGSFGGAGELSVSVQTGQNDLNAYSPAISLNDSGIGYAGNRVASLKLMRIKWVMSNGQEYEIQAPIDIDSDLDPWN